MRAMARGPRGRRSVALGAIGGWLAIVVLGTIGCTDRASTRSTKPVVAVSVAPQAYLVRQLAGSSVDIEILVPPGGNPHTYEPTIEQLRDVQRAVIYLKVGHPRFPFEQVWLPRVLAQAPQAEVINFCAGVEVLEEDPHVWTSPAAMQAVVPRLADALRRQVPQIAPEVSERERVLRVEIEDLRRAIATRLGNPARRRFYVFHPAWAYLARDLGLEQVAIEDEGKEPDPYQLSQIMAQARRDGVRRVFAQPQFSRRSAELVAREIGAEVVVLDPLAEDWTRNLRTVVDRLSEELG